MHATIADVIADTAQNSIEAGASRVEVSLVEDGVTVSVRIADNGKGMDEATQRRAFNPFYTEPGKHDKRRVGLGLPILKQLCEATEGGLSLESAPGRGTTLSYHFRADHVDLPPMGDIAAMVLMLFNYPGEFELVFTHRKGGEEYEIARSELADAVGGLESVEGLTLAKEFLASQESALP
ncbi:MAG: sensor histidine kinase [Kiritimatiellae bacterium]|nr:sensor histidine kinase [Kiritimatiellia bacterium]